MTTPGIPSLKHQRRRGCLSKLSFNHLWQAEVAIRDAEQRDLLLHVYACPFSGNHYHLTRKEQDATEHGERNRSPQQA